MGRVWDHDGTPQNAQQRQRNNHLIIHPNFVCKAVKKERAVAVCVKADD